MEFENNKSLVADYDSSSEDEDMVSQANNPSNDGNRLAPAMEMLAQSPKIIPSSVFTNPYKEIENYEQSVLEKHVKMTSVKESNTVQVKPCYKFYKGKCRLGEKCKFAHNNPTQTISPNEDGISEEVILKGKEKSKKRSGLKDDLMPPKKFMKTYNKLK